MEYAASNGQSVTTPPIWKQFTIMSTNKEDSFPFDEVDDKLAVNLNFALKAGKEIGAMLGYQAIEPLQLDELMIRLHTVNLPSVPKSIKSTFGINLQYTHTIAWLIGLITKATDLNSFMVYRSLLKYLTTKGVFLRDSFKPEAVFRDQKSLDDVETISRDAALNAAGMVGNLDEYLFEFAGNKSLVTGTLYVDD